MTLVNPEAAEAGVQAPAVDRRSAARSRMRPGRHSRRGTRNTSRCGSVGLAVDRARMADGESDPPGDRTFEEAELPRRRVQRPVEPHAPHRRGRRRDGARARCAGPRDPDRATREFGTKQRTGRLFGPRYHARTLKSPRDVRNTLRYVLLNRKHHAASQRFHAGWIHLWSSAIWFRGWSAPIRMSAGFNRQLAKLEAPTSEPRTWLLRVGWHRAGSLSYDDRPARLERDERRPRAQQGRYSADALLDRRELPARTNAVLGGRRREPAGRVSCAAAARPTVRTRARPSPSRRWRAVGRCGTARSWRPSRSDRQPCSAHGPLCGGRALVDPAPPAR